MRAEIPVRHILRAERIVRRIGGGRDVVGIPQPDLLNIVPVQHAGGGNSLRAAVIRRFRRTQGRAGGTAAAQAVARHNVNLISDAIGQTVDRSAGAGLLPAGLLERAALCRPVIHLIICGVLPSLPRDAESAVQRTHIHHIRRVRPSAGQGCGQHRSGGLALPGPVDGGHGELIGYRVLQAGDFNPIGPRPLVLPLGVVLVGGAVAHLITGNVGQGGPGERYPLPSGLSGEAPNGAVGRHRVFRDNVLQKLDALHNGKISALGLCDGDGDFLHRNPLAQRNGNHIGPRRPGDAMDTLGQAVVKGILFLISLLVHYRDGAFENLARLVRCDNLQLPSLDSGSQNDGNCQRRIFADGCALIIVELGGGPCHHSGQGALEQLSTAQSQLRLRAPLVQRRGQQDRL